MLTMALYDKFHGSFSSLPYAIDKAKYINGLNGQPVLLSVVDSARQIALGSNLVMAYFDLHVFSTARKILQFSLYYFRSTKLDGSKV